MNSLQVRGASAAKGGIKRLARIGMVGSAGLFVAAGLGSMVARSHGANEDALNLKDYRLTFDENFSSLSVSAWGPASAKPRPGFTRWIAHTPWNGDFGDAAFTDPSPGFPFTVNNGVLKIEARKSPDGKWRSGLLSSTDPKGGGFTQEGGYFEMRAKLPPGPGVWPAFWLDGNTAKDASAELDAMEYYGQFPDGYQVALHVWPKDKSVAYKEEKKRIKFPDGFDANAFHSYGVSVDRQFIKYYLDRREVARMDTPPQFNQPMFILLDLALGSGWPIDKTRNPSDMYVQWVRAYANKE